MASCILKISLPILLITNVFLNARPSGHDTLDIRYEIVTQIYLPEKDVIKVRVPPFLSTVEVMEQVRLVFQWPGDPPPKKLTNVYVFKETDSVDEVSTTGATFIPGKGISWSLKEWEPIELSPTEPTVREKLIYNALLDTLFARGLSLDNKEIKNKFATEYGLTVSKLDSIYFKVKYWKSY